MSITIYTSDWKAPTSLAYRWHYIKYDGQTGLLSFKIGYTYYGRKDKCWQLTDVYIYVDGVEKIHEKKYGAWACKHKYTSTFQRGEEKTAEWSRNVPKDWEGKNIRISLKFKRSDGEADYVSYSFKLPITEYKIYIDDKYAGLTKNKQLIITDIPYGTHTFKATNSKTAEKTILVDKDMTITLEVR